MLNYENLAMSYTYQILKLKGYHCVYGYINTKDLIGPEI